MMNFPLVSVIVPAYNAEKSLRLCVDSILQQEYANLELIITDDGSTDGTGEICDGYAEQDSRVRVIHKQNGGVAAARNAALDVASGEFVCCVDSDDYVSSSYVSNLISHVADGVDVVISGAVNHYGEDTSLVKYTPCLVAGRELERIFTDNVIRTNPWGVLYRRSMLVREQIRFPEDMRIGEDAVFLMRCLKAADRVIVTSDTDYDYNYVSESSLTKKLYHFETELLYSRHINDAVDSLMRDKAFKEPVAIQRLSNIKSAYLRRCMDSIYFVESWNRKQRMEALKSLDTSYMWLAKLRHGNRLFLLTRLAMFRMWSLYDVFRSVAATKRK